MLLLVLHSAVLVFIGDHNTKWIFWSWLNTLIFRDFTLSEQHWSLWCLRKYVRTHKYAGLNVWNGHVCYVWGGSMPSQWGKMKWHTPTPDMIGGNCILMSRRPISTLHLVFPWSTSGVKNSSMCFYYSRIYTSKHSSQHSSQQEFIVVVTLLLLSDIMSKHIGLSARATCVCFPLSLSIWREK